MMTADESILKSITADELVYGHSSGKVQNKSEFIAEILSGQPLTYVNIEPLEQTIQMAGDAAVVRHIFTAETKNPEGEPGSLRIGNMLVWKLHNGEWKLLARQAYRL
jgi:ketosteroid isomerase-like protein